MKKIICLLVIAVFLCTSSYAATGNDYLQGAGDRLWRGAVNTLTGWVEFPMQISKGWNRGFNGDENNKLGGALVGIFAGVGHTLGRTISGMGDLAGFWAAAPENNDGIGTKLDAEYAWEEGTAYDMFDPNFGDATLKPIGNKFLRGAGNCLGGFLEFPGQIVKGIQLGAMDLGIVKGFWYWMSRQVDGTFDVAGCLFPNPEDTKGLAFDEKWPWTALGDGMKGEYITDAGTKDASVKDASIK